LSLLTGLFYFTRETCLCKTMIVIIDWIVLLHTFAVKALIHIESTEWGFRRGCDKELECLVNS
jgi:hypothetical protein